MPWPPGSSPVMNVDQATGLCGGIGGAERAEAASGGDLAEMRHPASRHQVARQLVVQAVEAEHDDPPAHAADACRPLHPDEHDERRGRTRRPPAEGCARSSCRPASGRPSMYAGGSMPNSRSTVGAMSTSAGSSVSIGRLQKRTPGTSRGSMQWSPLHAFVLSSKTGPATTPVAPSHDIAVAGVVADHAGRARCSTYGPA